MNEKQFKGYIMPLHKTLYAYALAILRDESDAADCLQDAFTKLWENRKRLEEVDNVAAYATVTVRHIALSMASRTKRPVTVFGDDPPDVADPSPTPAAAIEGKDNLQTVAELLAKLPENQRKVVMMSAVTGLSNSEISSATGLSDDNVRVLLSRGRKRIRQLFSLHTK
jgi:RNA polymerase sigma factor, sigma-70 family